MPPKPIPLLLSLCALPLLAPASARACTCYADPLLDSLPADGATGVPTNVALWVEGWAERLVLTAADGSEVDFEVESLGTSSQVCGGEVRELKPKSPLLPDTRYTLVASSGESPHIDRKEVSFETGEGKLAGAVPEPTEVELVRIDGEAGISCGSGDQLCVRTTVPDGALAVLRQLTPEGAEVGAMYFDSSPHLASSAYGSPDCYRLWLRDATGQRSAAKEVCGVTWLHPTYHDVPTVNGYDFDCDAAFARVANGEGRRSGEDGSAPDWGTDRDDYLSERLGPHDQSAEETVTGPDAGVDRAPSRVSDGIDAGGGCSVASAPAPRPGAAPWLLPLGMAWLLRGGRRRFRRPVARHARFTPDTARSPLRLDRFGE